MKRTIVSILCGVLVIGITGCESNKNLTLDENGVIELGDNFKISTKEKTECEHEVEEYYNKDEQKVYFVCLDKVNLNIDNKEMSLKSYLKEYGINDGIDEIIKKLEIENALNDGGTIIYRDSGTIKYSNNGITIIKCKTISGNKDVYIGTGNLDYYWGFDNGGFCSKDS